MCHQSQLDDAYVAASGEYDFTGSFTDIAPYISAADLAIANLETTISGKDQQYTGYPNFNSPKSLLTALKQAGFDVLTTANEHIFDRKWYGVEQTIANIKAEGMACTGTFLSRDEYYEPLVVDVNGVKVAILAYTDLLSANSKDIPDEKMNFCIKMLNIKTVRKDIELSREKGADIVIVSVHWGDEYSRKATSEDRATAEDIIKAGADVILGSHPHVLQTITYRDFEQDAGGTKKCAVVYSLGNFLSAQTGQYKDSGMVVNLTFDKDNQTNKVTLKEVTYLPTWVYISDADKKEYRILPVGKYLDDSTLLGQLAEHMERPADALARWERREMQMFPPTVASLRQLAQYANADAAIDAARQAAVPPVLLPRLVLDDAGRFVDIVLPGDDRYESTPVPEYVMGTGR